MITHIVFWKLLNDSEHDADANAARIKEGLEALVGVVPGLLTAQVGRGLVPGDYDLCLLSTFDTVESLNAYRTNPDHVKVANFVHTAVSARTALDFENDAQIESDIDPFVL